MFPKKRIIHFYHYLKLVPDLPHSSAVVGVLLSLGESLGSKKCPLLFPAAGTDSMINVRC